MVALVEMPIELHCPDKRCRQRFLLEGDGAMMRGVCPSCGGEIVYRAKEKRGESLTIPAAQRKVSTT